MTEYNSNIFSPPILDLSVERYAAWKNWKEKWDDFVVVTELEKKSAAVQCSTLRYTFTDETRRVYNTLPLSENDKKDSTKIIEALEVFAKGIVNETLERHAFNNKTQEKGECFDDFITTLKTLSKNCGFCDNCHNSLIRDRIVAGTSDESVRRKLLADPKLTLKQAEDICRSHEKAIEGAKTFEQSQGGDIYNINRDPQRKGNSYNNRNPGYQKPSSNYQQNPYQKNNVNQSNNSYQQPPPCKFCNRKHKFGRNFCPAYGKTCSSCKLLNHFHTSSICKVKNQNAIDVSEDEYLGALFLGAVETTNNDMSWEIEMPAISGNIHFKIDTGADVTIIGEEELEKLNMDVNDVKKTTKRLMGPTGEKLKCLGYIITTFTWGDKTTEQLCYVCKNIKKNLLGKPTINALKMIELNSTDNITCSQVVCEPNHNDKTKQMIAERPKLFKGLGTIKNFKPIHIKLKGDAKPFNVGAPRHIAIPLFDPLIKEIRRMETLGVIRKIDEPTEWCHPIVPVVKPNGSIRICIDLTKLNKDVERELYQLEPIEETIAKLGPQCKIMSKLDLNSGYWQMPLDKASQILTTFITPIGRYCMTVGPFGLSSMQEIFNKRLDHIIEGLEGVSKSTDDLLIYGKNEHEHKINLIALLNRLEEYGVTLNPDKCSFEQCEVEFLGVKISPDGITPLQSKIDAVNKFQSPENITELRRFLGMAEQMAKFHEKLAEAKAPLRDLLSSNNSWIWTEHHEESFQNIKKILTNPTILKLYDHTKPTKLRVDGSQLNGIGAILYQQHDNTWYPVACASRFLTPTEKGYHNIEIEMLAITWGIEKMKMYLHGLPHFIVETDHKPLVPMINNKSLGELSSRIQRMRMRLLSYNFTVRYVRGKEMADADAFSRKPVEQPTQRDEVAELEIETHVAHVIQMLPASNERINEIREETKKDKKLQELSKIIKFGWPSTQKELTEAIKPFWTCRAELTEHHGLILKGHRIVIPETLRRSILNKLHEGHQGIDKTKRRARQSCYWPNINHHIEQKVKNCNVCFSALPSKPHEPLVTPPLPTKSWQKVGSDLFSTAGKNYLIITDYYSLWPEVYEMEQITSRVTINAIRDTFARHGVPDELVTDNGSQYTSKDFQHFKKDWQFQHTTSSPRHPQSNGLAEASVKIVKNMIKKCNRNREDIQKGLMIIRNTPLQCGYSPAQLLMNRVLQDNLPRIHMKNDSSTPTRNIDQERIKQQIQFNKKVPTIPVNTNFKEKQKVAIQHHITKEWSIRGTIIRQVAPRSYTVQLENGRTLRRNTKDIRRIHELTVDETIKQTIDTDNISCHSEDTDNETIPFGLSDNNNTSDSDISEEETVAYDISDNDNTNSDDNNEEETIEYDSNDNDTKSDNNEVEMVPPEEIRYVTRYGRKVKNNLKNEYQYQTFC